MAAAKRRFPYSATDAPNGGVLAERADGRQYRFTGPAGDRARQMAAAQAALAPRAPAPTEAITDDAHQFNVLAGGLDLPRTARGGVRDLAPADAVAAEAPATVDASMAAAPTGRAPTLAETQETAAYTGESPDSAGWDTVYEDPAEEERRKAAKAAALGAHVKHAADVSWYDPEKPIAL